MAENDKTTVDQKRSPLIVATPALVSEGLLNTQIVRRPSRIVTINLIVETCLLLIIFFKFLTNKSPN